MYYFLMLVASYFLGSISFAVVVSRLMNLPDPHSYGSGNPGATNVLLSGSRVALALSPVLALFAMANWLVIVTTLRHTAALALVGTLLTPVFAWWELGFSETTLAILVMNAIVVYRHLPNMKASTATG